MSLNACNTRAPKNICSKETCAVTRAPDLAGALLAGPDDVGDVVGTVLDKEVVEDGVDRIELDNGKVEVVVGTVVGVAVGINIGVGVG